MGPSNADLSAKVDELQVALDAEQQQVKDLLEQKDATIATLGETITALEAQVAEGGTAEERQAILDKLNALKADLEGTVADEQDSQESQPGNEG